MTDALNWLQLPERKIAETLKNKQLTEKLTKIVNLARETSEEQNGDVVSSKSKANFFYTLGSKFKPQWEQHLPLLIKQICNENIKNDAQFNAACDYLLSHSAETKINDKEFEEAFGAGVVVTIDQIEDTIARILNQHKNEVETERYNFNVGKLLMEIRKELPWADGATIKRELDLQLVVLLGPRTEADLAPKPKDSTKANKSKGPVDIKPNTKSATKTNAVDNQEEETSDSIDELLRTRVQFHPVGENYRTDGYVVTEHTMQLLKDHVQMVGGKVHTRFPPEPNGILHIGHAKAININFGFAKAMGGNCYLRFDDTNPEKEEEKFFKGIEDMVNWLGYTPYKITHSSDYFDQLYQWAEKLIEKDLAYVCHQRVDEMRGREQVESPWRNRPKEESLALFRDMKHGKFDEGEATLRLKHVMEEGKIDPVAYRIKFIQHHRTGDKWCIQLCIYPTYDYTHCLCDSIENITHSLCTKEFQTRRSSYYWLCNALEIYCPVQWEYGRLNVAYTVVSKRKILSLIETGVVKDWDDPRLFTLTALRRRGIPAEVVNKFVAKMGVSVARSSVHPHLLDAVVRDNLNVSAPRTMVVVEPLKLTIQNFEEFESLKSIEVPDFPAEKSEEETTANASGRKHTIAFDRVVYIENDDYRESAPKNFRRLTNSQSMGLKYVGLVLTVVGKEEDGLLVKAEKLTVENKPKAFVHWVAKPEQMEVRVYHQLFKHENPEDKSVVPDGFLSDINEKTLDILPSALCDRYLLDAVKSTANFQFERIGFFALDSDTTDGHLVFNRTVSLREDSGKN
ncbi:Glutaminyl-tRNA synthetase [Aphelenchoides besseyi]|nr:Glutaminyl-tRNA synthetase [Aphelenchoides besseyi]KAI6222720.1 Glutaminyl-tRNA synthetase [Aphelenchoides besseyi]